MSDVGTETGLIENMYNFFSISQVGGGGGLMYHNLNMGVSNNQTAKVAVYDPFVASATGGPEDLALSAWYNYSQTPTAKLDMTFTNNNSNFDITCIIYITDPAGAFSQVAYTTPSIVANGGTDVQTNYDCTLVQMDTTNFTAGVYYIEMYCSAIVTTPPPPSPPYPGIITTVGATPTDTDGVGAGTVRNRNVAILTFDDSSPLAQIWIVRGNIGGTNGIYINKRTTFSVTFT